MLVILIHVGKDTTFSRNLQTFALFLNEKAGQQEACEKDSGCSKYNGKIFMQAGTRQ